MPDSNSLHVCWTTLPSEEAATQLAREAVANRLAACVQIDGPFRSVYLWDDELQEDREFRLTLKTTESRLLELEEFIQQKHPYDTPQWVCVKAEKVSEKYLKWVNEVCNLRGFL